MGRSLCVSEEVGGGGDIEDKRGRETQRRWDGESRRTGEPGRRQRGREEERQNPEIETDKVGSMVITGHCLWAAGRCTSFSGARMP